jgi:hypothetical protein
MWLPIGCQAGLGRLAYKFKPSQHTDRALRILLRVGLETTDPQNVHLTAWLMKSDNPLRSPLM